jgi:hypothetical protein
MKLKKCIILLPTSYNDGTLVPTAIVRDILKEIDREFDGHSVDGYVDGTYRMDDGSMASDRSLKIWIAVREDGVEHLKKLARKMARTLKQESIWFEVTGAEVEFIRALPDSGD